MHGSRAIFNLVLNGKLHKRRY